MCNRTPAFQMEQKKSLGGLCFPFPFQGHISPMLQLASILHARGFSITIIHTRFNSPDPSNYPHFRFCSISDGLSQDQAVSSEFNDLVALTILLNSNCVAPFGDCLSRLLSSSEMEDPILCLVTDTSWYFTQTVANSLKVPRIVLRTSNVSAFLAFNSTPFLHEIRHLSLEDSPAENQVPDFPPHKSEDFFTDDKRDRENLILYLSSMYQETRASSGIIFNSCEYLEREALKKCSLEFPIPVFTIGPFHKYISASSSSLLPQDQNSISWLDKQAPNSVIYVSIGSVVAITEIEFLEVAWGLANSKQSFLWVVRPGSVHGLEWLEPLPEGFLEMIGGRGYIVKWAPQQEVLAHPATGGFWTHCGWNSTLESLSKGFP